MRYRTLMPTLSLVTLCLVAGGCAQNSISSREDENVTSSLKFDAVACPQLIAQRNALAAQYKLPQDAKPEFSGVPVGFGTVMLDARSSNQRGAQKARGEIDAMNRSLVRRTCIAAPPKA